MTPQGSVPRGVRQELHYGELASGVALQRFEVRVACAKLGPELCSVLRIDGQCERRALHAADLHHHLRGGLDIPPPRRRFVGAAIGGDDEDAVPDALALHGRAPPAAAVAAGGRQEQDLVTAHPAEQPPTGGRVHAGMEVVEMHAGTVAQSRKPPPTALLTIASDGEH